MAQLAEHVLGKDEVTRSNRVSSSKGLESMLILSLFCSLKLQKKVCLERHTEIVKFLILPSVFCKAIAAIYRAIISRLKRNFARFATRSANSIIHLAASTGSAIRIFPCIAARLATLRLIRKAFFSKKLLLTGSKHKFLATILANQSLISVHYHTSKYKIMPH